MDPEAALREYKQRLDIELERYFSEKSEEAGGTSDFAGKMTENLAEFTMRGGKRFRPALVYHAYRLFGGNDGQNIVRTSIFMEMIQSFLLIHDDIMDRSNLRRGGPTMHVVYERFSAEEGFGDDAHFGRAMAIIAGDLANQYALDVVESSSFPAERKGRLVALIAREVSQVFVGQVHDILLGYGYPKGFDEADVLEVYWYKTATYTFKLPLCAGAILAGATDADLAALEAYAMPCGVAYQIQDDILGAFGESRETGKSNKDDFMEGKRTLLVAEAEKQADEPQRARLEALLGKKDMTDSEADEIRVIMRDTGALDYARKVCEDRVGKAKAALIRLGDKDADALEFLDGMAEYMLGRNA